MFYLQRLGNGHRYNLTTNKDIYYVGRSASSDIHFASAYVSRKHCEIRRILPYGTLIITNCTSTNITHVDDAQLNKIGQLAELKVGALIGLGVPINIHEEQLSDERFVYLRVCQETQNNVAQEINEVNSNHVLDQSKASTVTANISQEEIDISNSENVSRMDDVEILYTSPITSNELLPFCIKKEIPLFPDISSGSEASSLPSSSRANIYNTGKIGPIKQEGIPLSERNILKNEEFERNSVLSNLTENIHCPKPFIEKSLKNLVPQKFKREKKELDVFSPNKGMTYKLNGSNENLRDDMNSYDSTHVTKNNISIRECKLEISGRLEDELEKEIEYEHINGVKILQQFIEKNVKQELLSSNESENNKTVKNPLRKCDDLTTSELTPDDIIILSDSSDEEDEIPCRNVFQEEKLPDFEEFQQYSDCNVTKKRECNDAEERKSLDLEPAPKRLKQDCDDINLENRSDIGTSGHAITFKPKNYSSFYEDPKFKIVEPTSSLVTRLKNEESEENNIQSSSLENVHVQSVKKCSVQLDRISEFKIKNLSEVSSSKYDTVGSTNNRLICRPFEKNNIISDSEDNIESTSDSEMSVDDVSDVNVKENLQNLDISLEKLTITEQKAKSSNDVEESKSCERDVSKIKKEPLELARLRSFFGDESSDDDNNDDDDDDDDVQVSYSQVDDIILVSSDDEASFNDEHSSTSLENVSFGPLPSTEMDKYEDDDFDLPDLLIDLKEEEICTSEEGKSSDSHLKDEENSEKEWWPFLSQGFFSDDEKEEEYVDNKTTTQAEIEKETVYKKRKTEIEEEKKNEVETKKTKVEIKKKTEVEIKKKKTEIKRKKETDVKRNKITKIERNKEVEVEINSSNKIERRSQQEISTEKETPNTAAHSKDLQSIINKINNRSFTKAKFTEPKLPPQRTKADAIPRKRGRRMRKAGNEEITSPSRVFGKSTENDTHSGSKHLDGTLKIDDTSVLKNYQSSPSISKPQRRYKKSPNIRKTLQKTHNFDIYKRKPEKKCHHLIDKSLKEQERIDRLEPDINRRENISILPKNKESVAAAKKGIAKISSKSRSEKLTEIDLFSVSTEAKPRAHSSFKIPKVGKSETKKINYIAKSSPHSILDVGIQGREEHAKEMPVTNDIQKSSSAFDVPEESNNVHDVITNERLNCFREPKSILRIGKANPYKINYRVRFPSEKDLVSIRPISPRQNKNCSGPDQVSQREKYFGRLIFKSAVTDPLEYILKICNWNWDWLRTYHEAKKSMKNPSLPTLCESSVLPTFTIYKSLADYQQVFANLLYYEAWENIYRDWEQYMENIVFLPCEIDVREMKVISESNPTKYYKVKVLSLITYEMSKQSQHPTTGSLIAMKHKRNNKAVYTFGYVLGFTKRNGTCVSENLKRISPQGASVIIIFEIIFSKRLIESDFQPGMVASFCNICYFRPTYRAFECLFHLRRSPLLPTILNPGDLSVFVSKGSSKNYLVSQLKMNEAQMKSIVEVSSKCVSEFGKPNLSLIHGPPGTGKTRVIAALITQINLLFKKSEHSSNRRILLCAPSNAAVDELVLRLVKLKNQRINLNIVRVGVKKSMHPDVGEYSFDVKVKKEFEKRQFPSDEKVRVELKKKKEYCDKAASDLQKARAEPFPNQTKIRQLEQRLHELMRSLKTFEDSCKFQLSKHESDQLFKDCKRKILMTAEVIAATLTSCLSGSIQEVFCRDKSPFACCVVDEAGQCKESEIWFPLQLGIKKLVLVGDHKQLPATALSQLSQGKNLHQSLFERVYHHVGIEKCRMDVIHSLNVQYRMHEDILSWPSMHFYNNDLVAADGISQQMKHALYPYLVFNVTHGGEEEKSTGEILNMREALFIRALIESQEEHLKGLSIGVLTPYSRQKNLINEKLSHLVNKYKIVVSTVDNFQGQEKDIIYCSFVRSNSSKKIGFVSDRHRLNVALTRARKSCFVIGDLSSLQSNVDWRSLIQDAHRRNLVRNIPPNMNFTDRASLLRMTLTN